MPRGRQVCATESYAIECLYESEHMHRSNYCACGTHPVVLLWAWYTCLIMMTTTSSSSYVFRPICSLVLLGVVVVPYRSTKRINPSDWSSDGCPYKERILTTQRYRPFIASRRDQWEWHDGGPKKAIGPPFGHRYRDIEARSRIT